MGMIYKPPDWHSCQPPDRRDNPLGSIWQCDECGRYRYLCYTESSWGPTWAEVRWWDFGVRRTIKQIEDGRRSFRSYT